MSYTRVNWQNSPNTATPLSAENLNKMDAGIKQNADDIEQLQQHTYDTELNSTSTNAPQNKAVYEAMQRINVETDPTLSVSGKAADAAATGDAIADVKTAIDYALGALFDPWLNIITETSNALKNHWFQLPQPMIGGRTYKLRFRYDYNYDLTQISGSYIFVFKGAVAANDTSQSDAVRIPKTDISKYMPNVWHEFELSVTADCPFLLVAYGGAGNGDHIEIQGVMDAAKEITLLENDTAVYDKLFVEYVHNPNSIVRTYIPYTFKRNKTYKVRLVFDKSYTCSPATNVIFSARTNASLTTTSIVDVIVPDIRGSISAGTYEYQFTATNDAVALYIYQYDSSTSFNCDVFIFDGTAIAQEVNTIKEDSGLYNQFEYNAVTKLSLRKYTLDCALYGTIAKPTGAGTVQGCAIFDGKLIQLFDGGTFGVYNLSDLSLIDSGDLGSVGTNNHSNNCMFGAKYANSDPLPLLYVTCGSVSSTVFCSVERFAVSDDTYSAESVQNITFDYDSFETSGFRTIYPVPNFFVDDKYLYLFGALQRTNGSTPKRTNRFVITKFALPDPTSGDAELTGADIYEQFVMPYTTEVMQGGTLYNGMLFHAFGYGGTSNEIRVFDVKTGIEIADINALNLPYASLEPESCAVYDDKLYMQTGGGTLYKIIF